MSESKAVAYFARFPLLSVMPAAATARLSDWHTPFPLQEFGHVAEEEGGGRCK